MRHISSILCWLKFYILWPKGAYQSKNLVKFHVNIQKSEILNFDGFLLSKSYKVSAKKVQKSYLSWYWKVMQSLKKNWLVISNMTRRFWWIFTQPLKSLEISFRWALFAQSIQVLCYKNTEELSFMTLNSDENMNKPWPCAFKYGMRNWISFHWSTQKSDKLYFDGLFLSKAYNVSTRKFHRNYVSWHWRVVQNLKEYWLMAWKMI